MPSCPTVPPALAGVRRSGAGGLQQGRGGTPDKWSGGGRFGIDGMGDLEWKCQPRAGRQVRHPRDRSGAGERASFGGDRVRGFLVERRSGNPNVTACSRRIMVGKAAVATKGARDSGAVRDDQRENHQERQQTAHCQMTISSAASGKAGCCRPLLSARYTISTPLIARMPRFGAAETNGDNFSGLRHRGGTEGAQALVR